MSKVGQTIALRGLSFFASARQHDRGEKPMWGRLATCAAVGYRRRSAAKAAGADCQSAAGYQPAPQNLVRQPTPAQFFMGFRGPKAHSNRVEKPPWTSGNPRGLPAFFMKFRGRNAHPNRPRKEMVCPTSASLTPA